MLSFQRASESARGPEGPITVFQHSVEAPPARCTPWPNDDEPPAGKPDAPFKIRVATSPNWRQRASSLIQRRYAWRGYATKPLESNADSGRFTLLASMHDATVATISATVDSPNGLYVETLFPDEVKALRDEGRRLCEFTKLAVDETVRSHSVLAAIFHVAYLFVYDLHDCTDVLIEVNPRHVRFYQRMLGFKPAAGLRMDAAVAAPAVLMRLDLSHSAAEIARLGGHQNAGPSERSLYPQFFAAYQSDDIVVRLRDHL